MKVERQKQVFVPVVLTLETEAEVRFVKSIIGNLRQTDANNLSGDAFVDHGKMWNDLNNAAPEVEYTPAEIDVTIY